MSYGLLEKLSHLKLPHEVFGDDVNLVRAYVAAGLVDAVIPVNDIKPDHEPPLAVARVLSVTANGRKTVEQKKVRLEISRLQGRRKLN